MVGLLQAKYCSGREGVFGKDSDVVRGTRLRIRKVYGYLVRFKIRGVISFNGSFSCVELEVRILNLIAVICQTFNYAVNRWQGHTVSANGKL